MKANLAEKYLKIKQPTQDVQLKATKIKIHIHLFNNKTTFRLITGLNKLFTSK